MEFEDAPEFTVGDHDSDVNIYQHTIQSYWMDYLREHGRPDEVGDWYIGRQYVCVEYYENLEEEEMNKELALFFYRMMMKSKPRPKRNWMRKKTK